jgi:hypothetical protein
MTTLIKKTTIDKQKSHAFKKDVYLLGKDADGIRYWLEAPSWDCGWYWGFGYVETYQQNRTPSKARDIDSHSHIDSSFMGKVSFYNTDKNAWDYTEYIHNIFDCPTFTETTFSEKEGWTLSELFKTFYQLRESADMFGKGGSHITTNPCADIIANKEWAKHINEVMIPAITAKILEILSPSN